MSATESFIYLVMFFLFGLIVGMGMGGMVLTDYKTKAVTNGCASFVIVDSLKGSTEFKWRLEK